MPESTSLPRICTQAAKQEVYSFLQGTRSRAGGGGGQHEGRQLPGSRMHAKSPVPQRVGCCGVYARPKCLSAALWAI